jgi:hypothetical protein
MLVLEPYLLRVPIFLKCGIIIILELRGPVQSLLYLSFCVKDCVYCIFATPRKCVNHPDTYSMYTSVVRNFIPLFKKCYELVLGV